MNKFKAGLVYDFGIKEIYIKKDGKLTKVEGENPEEVKKQLLENHNHLVAFADEDNIHHNLGFPVWFFQDKIIIFTHFTIGESEQKGITI